MSEMVTLRQRLVAALVEADREAERARSMLVKPFSNMAEWSDRLAEARGMCRGLAQAIELLDRQEAI